MYLKVLGQHPKVSWRRMICNYPSAPKWLFILNLVGHGKLYTGDRLAGWGLPVDPACVHFVVLPRKHYTYSLIALCHQLYGGSYFSGREWIDKQDRRRKTVIVNKILKMITYTILKKNSQ